MFLSALPIVAAQEESCGLTNLGACLPQKFFEFFLNATNASLAPFLNFIKSLMSEPVNVSIFSPIWAIIVYIISLFYGLFLVYVGFNFIISGYDSAKRENAKHWLKNIVLMVVFVQASFFIYQLILQLASLLSGGIMDMINQNFFLLTLDNTANMGLELFFSTSYLVTLFLTSLLLTLRYLFVAVGAVFFPIGIFLSFIEPLESYGKLILNSLLIMILLPFFQTIVLLTSSKLLEQDVFGNFKIIVMIGAFTIINMMMLFLILFATVKAVNSVARSDVGRVIISSLK
jgi:hypothetical protein